MISLNDTPITVEHFLDGTQRIFHFPVDKIKKDEKNQLYWKYEAEEELSTLIYVVGHLREKVRNIKLSLVLPYIPNARMDRTHGAEEVFTLKYFCGIINYLGFDHVMVLDPHSYVSEALLDRIIVTNPASFIQTAVSDIISELKSKEGLEVNSDNLLIYFPDAGAMKRYTDLFGDDFKQFYGEKTRDFKTGKILGIEIKTGGLDLTDKVVLMVDDIVSYGGTLAYSSDEIKKLGAKHIFAFASHTENSVLDETKGTLLQRFKNGTVDRLYTTNSLITKNSEYIKLI